VGLSDMKVARVLEWFQSSPYAEELARHEATERVQRRTALALQLDELRAAAGREFPALNEKAEQLRQRADAAREALRKVETAWGSAQIELQAASTRFTNQTAALERELRETAEPAIDAFRAEIEEEWADFRRFGYAEVRAFYASDEKTIGGRPLDTWNNSRWVHLRSRGYQLAVRAIDELKLVPAPDLEAEKRRIRETYLSPIPRSAQEEKSMPWPTWGD
jgi:hypothetical protein